MIVVKYVYLLTIHYLQYLHFAHITFLSSVIFSKCDQTKLLSFIRFSSFELISPSISSSDTSSTSRPLTLLSSDTPSASSSVSSSSDSSFSVSSSSASNSCSVSRRIHFELKFLKLVRLCFGILLY